MSKFKYVSLFAGIGGFDLALNNLGGECVLASEIDKYASQAYSILYGKEHLRGDVTKIDENDVPDHDLLAFGFPCQAFSVAGKRLGFEEARGTLFFEAARIAKAKKPKVLLAENVKGLISHDKGKTLDTIIQTLDEIGYTVDFEVMNSKYFGVPQNRERIFIVAIRNDLIEPSEWSVGKRSDVVAKGKKRISQLGVKTFNFDWPAQNEVTVRLRDILESDVDEKYYLSEEKTAKLVAQLEEKDRVPGTVGHHPFSKKFEFSGYNSEISPTLLATDYKAPKTLLESAGLPIREATKQGYAIAEEGDAVNFQFPDSKTRRGRVGKQLANTLEASGINQGVVEPQMLGHIELNGHDAIKRVYDVEGVSPTLTTMGGGHREPKIAEEQAKMAEIARPENLAYCIDANYTKGIAPSGIGKGRRTHVEEATPRYRIRKLTPRECFRLQGFPDSEFDKLTASGISNSQLYKMAGNAVTTNVIDAIGKRLVTYLND